MLMHVIAHGGVHSQETVLKIDSGRKFTFHMRKSNLCEQCAGPKHYHLSYIPNQKWRIIWDISGGRLGVGGGGGGPPWDILTAHTISLGWVGVVKVSRAMF